MKANERFYDALAVGEYAEQAPHLQHESIFTLYLNFIEQLVAKASVRSDAREVPRILDVGAGDGLATLPMLERGASVVAVDVSRQQLAQLERNCRAFANRLEIRCGAVEDVVGENETFDAIVANSVLHHIPDYLGLISRLSKTLGPGGAFMSFQDPMYVKSMSYRDRAFSWIAYVSWRLTQGDVIGGSIRRVRRMLGIYQSDSIYDNTEYHAVRKGVDQNSIVALMSEVGFECEVYKYGSFHSRVWQSVGEQLSIHNTFALMCQKL